MSSIAELKEKGVKIYSIVGNVDSRVLVYPIARALALKGAVAVVTDDGCYKRLYTEPGNKGSSSGFDIYFGVINDDIFNKINNSGIKYDIILTVSADIVPNEADGIIVCTGSLNTMDGVIESRAIEVPEEIPKEAVHISYDTVRDKGVTSITIKEILAKYVYSCEERKEVQPIEDKNIIKLLSGVASKAFSIDKSDMEKLLTRKEYIKSGKVK